MNILYIHTHDSGRYFQHLGAWDAPTPHVSKWAVNQALTFRNAFCAGPTCSPSRASLLSGRYPHSTGMLGLAHRGFAFHDYSDHAVNLLKSYGYKTILCGVQHEGAGCFDAENGGAKIGYEEILCAPNPEYPADGDQTAAWDKVNASKAADWLSQKRKEPFFFSCGFYSTHREYPFSTHKASDTLKPPRQIADTSANREDHGRFLESLSVFDGCFETVIRALESGPHAEDTIVLLTTDHGLALPFSKCHLNEAGMGVSLSIRVPGLTDGVGYTDALVSHVDVLPTLFQLLNLSQEKGMQGQSFASLFANPRKAHREFVFGEVNFHTSYEPMRSVRTERYNYIHHFDPDKRMVHLSNIDESPSKACLIEHGLQKKIKPMRELYDLLYDPMEKNNLAEDSGYQKIVEDMESRLIAWQVETNDPLLKGELPLMPSYTVNTAECTIPDSLNKKDYVQIGSPYEDWT